jgi:hypothetical protein
MQVLMRSDIPAAKAFLHDHLRRLTDWLKSAALRVGPVAFITFITPNVELRILIASRT